MRIKTILVFSVIAIFVGIVPSINAQTEIPNIDLKSKLFEKDAAKTEIVKVAAGEYLKSNGFDIVNGGEDYAVWIKNYSRTKNGNIFTVKVTVNITAATFRKEKEAYDEQTVTFSYDVGNATALTSDNTWAKATRKILERKTRIEIMEAISAGKPIGDAIIRLYNEVKR